MKIATYMNEYFKIETTKLILSLAGKASHHSLFCCSRNCPRSQATESVARQIISQKIDMTLSDYMDSEIAG